MDISDWRRKIDEIDRKIVELLNQRAQAAYEIGLVKRDAGLPIYEPEREQAVFANARDTNSGPLSHRDLLRIFERIIDIMRQIQGQVIAPANQGSGETLAETELDSKIED
ncbi:MAG: chorismate mutase [Acidobacteriales bacterium]|nr:chorismate mutase [Terriglobales bacterium]